MQKIFFNNPWQLSFADPGNGKSMNIPAQVPGNVLGDLQRAGIIPDPYYSNNSDKLRAWEFIDWEYFTVFDIPELKEREKLQLVFEGLDTFAEILINDIKIGDADNMFLAHKYVIDHSILRPGTNTLRVHIRSAVNEARKYHRAPYSRSFPSCYDGLFLRRPMHSYGWDIAPRLVGAGIWRDVYLQIVNPERWTDVYLATVIADPKSSTLNLSWSFESDRVSLENYSARLVMTCRDSRFEKSFPLHFVTGNLALTVPDVYLWHPAGSGKPDLYDVTLELIHDGTVVDTRCWRCGIRTVDLIRSDESDIDLNGEFAFVVNGKKLFIKGANWVPANALHGEQRDRIEKILELYTELNCNMLRCWGGGVYEDEKFFDYCDEHGLLVWQDFMFACETAPQDGGFLEIVRKEAEAVVCRLRNHASLALWCGDNECDYPFFGWLLNTKLPPSFNRISREVLPRAVGMYDGRTDYLPSSPFLSDSVWKKHDMTWAAEQHLWSREFWKSDSYRKSKAVFVSEIGYPCMPAFETIKKFIPAEDFNNRKTYSWVCHAAQQFGELDGPFAGFNDLLEQHAKAFWGEIPSALEEFVPYSQVVQAEALKYFVELFRSAKFRRTGILWWQMIDCWPQFSPAVVDYYFVRKLAFYYIKLAQRQFIMTLSDPEGWDSNLTAVNDTMEDICGTYSITDLLTGECFKEGEFASKADSAGIVTGIPLDNTVRRMLLIRWSVDGKTSYNHFLTGYPAFDFKWYMNCLEKLYDLVYRDLGMDEKLIVKQ